MNGIGLDNSPAIVTLLTSVPPLTFESTSGSWEFMVPSGCHAVVVGEAQGRLTMLRGVLSPNVRGRDMWNDPVADGEALLGALSLTQDPEKGMLEPDFRNLPSGSAGAGWGVNLRATNGSIVEPGYCIAFSNGFPQVVTPCKTISGGSDSTLFAGNIPPGVYTLEPVAPSGATNFACDLPLLPILPNTVTQVDYETDTSRNCE
jgi:hypothetical protein